MADPVPRQYDRAARTYDRLWAGYVRHTLDLLDDHARIAPGTRVLDVGCGTGTFAARLLARDPSQAVTGVDASGGMLAQARRKAPDADFVRARMEALPFRDATFDVVVSTSALHYARHPGAALAEMARVLRPGGDLALVDWDRGRWTMALMDRLLRLADPAHGRTLSVAEIGRLAVAAGLDVPRVARARHGVWSFAVLTARR